MRVALMAVAGVLASTHATHAQQWERSPGSAFQVKVQSDSVSGGNRSLVASDGRTSLFWACRSDGMMMMVIVAAPMMGDSTGNILFTYRFDQRPPFAPVPAEVAVNKRAAILPAAQARLFMGRARLASRAIVNVVDPLNGTVWEDTLSMNGFAEAIARLNNCS